MEAIARQPTIAPVRLGTAGASQALRRLTASLPSIAVTAALVVLALVCSSLVPAVPAVAFALVFGIAAGEGAAPAARASFALPYGVPLTVGFVLMGAQVDREILGLVGWGNAGLLLLFWACTGVLCALAAKLRLLPGRLAAMLALGLCGCGVSAVASAARLDRRSAGQPQVIATSVILASGALALLVFPGLGGALGLDSATFGAVAGLSIANNAEALATAGTGGGEALLIATSIKLLANTLEGLAVLLYLWLFAGRTDARLPSGWKLPLRIPGFVIGFAATAGAGLLGAFDSGTRGVLGAISQLAFLAALVGVGYRTRIAHVIAGGRAIVVGLVVWALLAALVLAWLT